jgi:hypothetical protein
MKGYDKLAAFIGHHPHMAMVRKFSALGIKDLLYRQAELAHLEKDLISMAREDSESNDPESELFQNSWWDLHRARVGDDFQWQKFKEIREKLSEYCESNASIFSSFFVFLRNVWLTSSEKMLQCCNKSKSAGLNRRVRSTKTFCGRGCTDPVVANPS